MPRVREIEDDGSDTPRRGIQEGTRHIRGLLNTTKVLAHCPAILRLQSCSAPAIEQSGQLPKGLRHWFISESPRSTAARSESTSIPSV